jgi:hypothetical protein
LIFGSLVREGYSLSKFLAGIERLRITIIKEIRQKYYGTFGVFKQEKGSLSIEEFCEELRLNPKMDVSQITKVKNGFKIPFT